MSDERLESKATVPRVPMHNPHTGTNAESPVFSPDKLSALAHEFLGYTKSDTASVTIDHLAIGMARVVMGRVRLQENGDTLRLLLTTRIGQRAQVGLSINQIDRQSLRHAAAYLDHAARELPGDATPVNAPVKRRIYLPNTSWRAGTADAFVHARHAAVSALITPMRDAGIEASAFVGVYAHTLVYADKAGLSAQGAETDTEAVVTGWTADRTGSGWAGQASREWNALDLPAIAAQAIETTRRSGNPVAVEPGRHTAILDRPAVAQIVQAMGLAFDARMTLSGQTPLYNPDTRRPRLGEQIVDARIRLTSDPTDRDGGCLPFNRQGYPLRAMTWIDRGVHVNLAFQTDFAASKGYAPANDPPTALRLERVVNERLDSASDMVAVCSNGILVTRFAFLESAGTEPRIGEMTGVTTGGCFLVHNGKIDKPIKNLRFLDSPWLFLNRVIAIGASERAAFGYAPWAGNWPIAPTIVPPLLIQDFNFTAMSDAV